MKLQSILKEIGIIKETVVTGGIDEPGHLWPFSTDLQHAKRWETQRLDAVFATSLHGWTQLRSITDGIPAYQIIDKELAGMPAKPLPIGPNEYDPLKPSYKNK